MPSVERANDAWLRLIVISLLGIAVAAVTGRLSVHMVNDSPSYLNYPLGSLSAAMLSIRTPGYPLWLLLITRTLGQTWIPLMQVLLHAIASWCLIEELHRRGMPIRSSLLAGFCVLVGCTATDHIHTISTDAPAASLGVIVAATLMRAYRTRSLATALTCMLFAALAIFVRPAYLFLIPWIATVGIVLAPQTRLADRATFKTLRQSTAAWDRSVFLFPNFISSRWSDCLLGMKIALGVAAIVLVWMGSRKVVVDDFSIAPFGHQNLSAILVQTVPLESLRQLPGESAALGQAVADGLQQHGYQSPAQSGDQLPTLLMESQWDEINYTVVWPAARDLVRRTKESKELAEPIVIHRSIGSLNRAILTASPTGYLRWLLMAVRRSLWGTAANMIMHPVFMVMVLIGMFGLLRRIASGSALPSIEPPDGWAAFAGVAIWYAICAIGFVILSSPPLGRFADAGAIFLPALIASLLIAPSRRHQESCWSAKNGSTH